jgi:hypothetical protein
VIGVDPRVHTLVGRELRPRRTKLCGDDRLSRSERGEEVGLHGGLGL